MNIHNVQSIRVKAQTKLTSGTTVRDVEFIGPDGNVLFEVTAFSSGTDIKVARK